MRESDDTNEKLQVNPGYVVGQLLREISTSATHPDPSVRQRALERVKRWEEVFQGMFEFAVGSLAAGGPLQTHETDLLSRLGNEAFATTYFASESADRHTALQTVMTTGCAQSDPR
jgi:hypothetical protein